MAGNRFVTVEYGDAMEVWAIETGQPNVFESEDRPVIEKALSDFDYWLRAIVPAQAVETDIGYTYPYSVQLVKTLDANGIGYEVGGEG